MSHSSDFVVIYVDPSITVSFSAAIIAVSVKPCIVMLITYLLSTYYDMVPLTYISRSTDFVVIFKSMMPFKSVSLQLWELNLA